MSMVYPSHGVSFNGTTITSQNGAKFVVDSQYADRFQGLINDLDAAGYQFNPSTSYGYSDRATASGGISGHASGIAIDINSTENPNVPNLTTTLPTNIGDIAAANGLAWGGAFRTNTDPMHFEVPNVTGSSVQRQSLGDGTNYEALAQYNQKPGFSDPVQPLSTYQNGGSPTSTATSTDGSGQPASTTGGNTDQSTTTGGNWDSGGGATTSSNQPATPYNLGDGFGTNLQGGNFDPNSIYSTDPAQQDVPAQTDGGPLIVRGITPTSTDSQAGATTSGSTGTSTPASTSSAGNGSSTASPIPGSGGFLDNPLNPYDQAAYHFTLYAASNSGGSAPDKSSGQIIAETGKTGFNLRSVTINGFVGPNQHTQSTTNTTFEMEVVEAMGTSFMDGLVLAAQLTGAENYQKSLYYLELYFKGYNADGSIIDPITTGMPTSNGKWVWTLRLNTVHARLTEGGVIYTLTGGIAAEISALSSQNQKSQNTLSITAATVGEFFTNLTSAWNKANQGDYGYALTTVGFQFMAANGMPDPSSWKLITEADSPYANYRGAGMIGGDGKRDQFTANIQRGTNLVNLPEQIVACTREGQSLIKYGDTSHTSNDDLNRQGTGDFRLSVVYRCYPKLQQGAYEGTTGNYKQTITYIVKPFQTQASFLHPKEASSQTVAQQSLKFAQPVTRKRYDYIFTGRNTEVIHMNTDLDFTMTWTLPRFAGFNYFHEQVATHAMYPTAAAQAQKQQQNALSQQSQTDSTAASQAAAAAQQTSQATAGSADSSSPGASASGSSVPASQTVNAQVNGATTAPAPSIASALNPQNLFSQVQQIGGLISAATGGASGQVSGSSGGNFIEDTLAAGRGGTSFTPIALSQQAELARRTIGTGVSGPTTTAARSVYGALIDQINNSIYMAMELELRGDPFWLGGVYDDRYKAQMSSTSAPDPTAGDVMLLIVFKYPNGVNDSGTPQFLAEQTYTGLYQCSTITHKFKDGRFTQTLNARRMPKVDATTSTSMNGGSLNSAPTNSTTTGSTGSTGSTTPAVTPATPATTAGTQSFTGTAPSFTQLGQFGQYPSSGTTINGGQNSSVPSFTNAPNLNITSQGSNNISIGPSNVDISQGSDSDWR